MRHYVRDFAERDMLLLELHVVKVVLATIFFKTGTVRTISYEDESDFVVVLEEFRCIYKILDMVRARLNDSTDVNTDYSVERLLMDVRKNMGDTDKVAFSLTVARVLSDVRDRLNDSNDFSYTYSLKRLIQEIRNNVSDNDNVTCSLNMSDILAKVRDNLGDNDSGTSTINQTEVLKQIRYNLDDSVLPYRWSDADLKSYMSAGIRDILLKRSDCAKKIPQ